MSLPDGKVKNDGVIIGTWPPFRESVGPHPDTRLSDVAYKLREQYRLAVQLPAGESRYHDTYPLRLHMRSETFQSGLYGAVARVIAGSGTILVTGNKFELEVGAWVYIPARLCYQFEGRVVSGMNFRVIYANLRRG